MSINDRFSFFLNYDKKIKTDSHLTEARAKLREEMKWYDELEFFLRAFIEICDKVSDNV